MMKKLILMPLILVFFLLLANCSKGDGEETTAEERVPVEVTVVQQGSVRQSLSYNGDIRAEYEVRVYSKIPDRIEQFFVDEGDFVAAGKPVARIAATTIEQGVKQAEAGLGAARVQMANLSVEFERAKRLNTENAMSKQQFDAIQTQYEAARAQVEQAEAMLTSARSQLSDATVTAPISGIIGKRYYEAGDMANPAVPLVTIVQMERVKITFNATEEDLGKLALGQQASIQVRSYKDKKFIGRVRKISPVLDPQTRMAEVEVLIDNKDGLLKPGMYARVVVTTGEIRDVLVVPRFTAIENTTLESVNGEDQVVKNYYVFTVNGGHAVQNKLSVKYVNHRYLAVDGGLSAGDSLVVSGQNNLRDGLPVVVVNREGLKK